LWPVGAAGSFTRSARNSDVTFRSWFPPKDTTVRTPDLAAKALRVGSEITAVLLFQAARGVEGVGIEFVGWTRLIGALGPGSHRRLDLRGGFGKPSEANKTIRALPPSTNFQGTSFSQEARACPN
jgi:hypothetical protein